MDLLHCNMWWTQPMNATNRILSFPRVPFLTWKDFFFVCSGLCLCCINSRGFNAMGPVNLHSLNPWLSRCHQIRPWNSLIFFGTTFCITKLRQFTCFSWVVVSCCIFNFLPCPLATIWPEPHPRSSHELCEIHQSGLLAVLTCFNNLFYWLDLVASFNMFRISQCQREFLGWRSPPWQSISSRAWNHQPPSSFTFVPKNGMTIPARPTLENMFQFPVFCFSEDGSSHFTPNRWNDDPQWNTHIFWAELRRWRKQSTVYFFLSFYLKLSNLFLGYITASTCSFVISQTYPKQNPDFEGKKRQDMGTLVFLFRQTHPIDLFWLVVWNIFYLFIYWE